MHTRPTLSLLAAALICSLFAAPAHAQRARVFVASYGSDSASCGSFVGPCRTFQQAVNVVLAGGEVTAIDSAGFGPVIINKAVSITSPNGVEAGVVTPSSNGSAIDINAPADAVIILQGLTVDGLGGAPTGINFYSGRSLTIRNSVIRNFSSSGVALAPSVASTIEISDTLVANNGGDGIYLQPTGNVKVYAVFNRVEAYNNAQVGIAVLGNLNNGTSGAAINCLAAHNDIGYEAVGSSAPNVYTYFKISRSSAINNNTGIYATDQGIVFASQNELEDNNQLDWNAANSGFIYTYGDNVTDDVGPPQFSASVNKF